MERDEQRAISSIRKLAERKLAGYAPAIQDKAELSLKDIGVEPETMKNVAGAAKLLSDLSNGKIDYNSDGLGVEATIRPEEKRLMLKYNKKF